MDSNPFPELKIDSPFFLNDIKGRSECPKCGKSRKFYCYSCYLPLGGPEFENKVPRIKLPVKIDVIKHPQEVDGKSTAVHAGILCPDDVTIYSYPSIPEYRDKHKVLLVFPSSDSITFEDYVSSKCTKTTTHKDTRLKESSINCNNDDNKTSETSGKDTVSSDSTLGDHEVKHSSNTELQQSGDDQDTQSSVDCGRVCQLKESDTDDAELSDTPNKRYSERGSGPVCKRLRGDGEGLGDLQPLAAFNRVVFIDSTWHTVNKISQDERLAGMQRIELKQQKTKFWRYQLDKPDTYLSTIEAIYYFLREYHTHFHKQPYSGQYDNLLFYFVFMYDKIRMIYEGGKKLKAYSNKS